MHRRITQMCHCEERGDVAISGRRLRFRRNSLLSGIVLRDCHVGLWPPRNDKPLIFTILTIACLFRRCSAGPGCPLPYKACAFGDAAL